MNLVHDVKPGHLWTPSGTRRGKISDMNAYLRMRRLLLVALDTYGLLGDLRISKSLYDDDAIAIHNATTFDYVSAQVPHALMNNGIQFTLKRMKSPFKSKPGISWLLVPVDQAACPPGRRFA